MLWGSCGRMVGIAHWELSVLMEGKVSTESGAHTVVDMVTECSSSTALLTLRPAVPFAKPHQIISTSVVRTSTLTVLPTKFSQEWKVSTTTLMKIVPGSSVAVNPWAMSLPTVNWLPSLTLSTTTLTTLFQEVKLWSEYTAFGRASKYNNYNNVSANCFIFHFVLILHCMVAAYNNNWLNFTLYSDRRWKLMVCNYVKKE